MGFFDSKDDKKDLKLTKIMLESLKKDPSLHSYEHWNAAGDYACEIRFFPHAFQCYKNAFELNKNQEIAEKLNTILDKVTNVLEVLPDELKEEIEDFRLSNPLDPAKWLAVSNKLLKKATEEDSSFDAARLALSFCAYCTLRSGQDISPINSVLEQISEDDIEAGDYKSPLLEFDKNSKADSPIRVVAYGDNNTLGLQGNWDIKFRDTYHFQWSQDSGEHITLANCGISGAGAMDALLYLKRDVLNYQPDITLINFGMNDAWLGKAAHLAFETIMENVVELLKYKTQVVLISPVPHIPSECPENEKPTDVPLEEVEIDSWYEITKKIAMKTNVHFLDLQNEFPKDPSERKKYFVNGYNHLNKEGNTLIKNALEKLIKFI